MADKGELQPGTVVRSLRLERVIGRGGMGVVYQATHLELGRQVAVKVLSAGVEDNARIQQRFQLEAVVTARLSHPNVVEVLEFWHDEGGRAFLVMELLVGRSLQSWLEAGEPPLPVRLGVARQILCGLEAAHTGGIVHRDVKPANVFLCPLAQGGVRVVLIDFGVAKLTGNPLAITSLGKTVGTPGFMAPEQIRGQEVDGRADLYAAGCLTFLILAGYEVFAGAMLEVMYAHLRKVPPPLSRAGPELSAFDAWMWRALEKRADDRFQTAADMRGALDLCCAQLYGAGDAANTLVDGPRAPDEG